MGRPEGLIKRPSSQRALTFTRSALIPLRSISKHMAMISFRKPYFASFMWHSFYNKHPLPEITYPPSRMILHAKLVLT